MNLYWEAQGQGRAMVVLHGWGLHGGVWQETTTALADRCRCYRVDLPGFGRSRRVPAAPTLPALAGSVVEAVPIRQAVWMGWSLGGMVALEAACAWPDRVQALVLVASSPRFVQGDDWPHGVPEKTLESFAGALDRDYREALMRFLVLQAGPDRQARRIIQRLRGELFRHGAPGEGALAGGLALLRESDLRCRLFQVACPTLVILGERDTLIPAAVGETLQVLRPDWQVQVMAGSAHAPFLSHSEKFNSIVRGFLDALP
jgi:pimeloyl-[acyl-carrier protein] methyl ester esterase